MNYDPDYVEQTMFYLEDLLNEKELDEIEAELQYKRNFPNTFLGAFDTSLLDSKVCGFPRRS